MRRENPALQQTSNLRFAQVDDADVIGFVKESVDARQRRRGRHRAQRPRPAHVLVPLRRDHHRPRRQAAAVRAIVNLVTGERHTIEWGGVRLTINPSDDPALLFRCEI